MFFVKYSKEKYLKDIINGHIRFAPISSYRDFEQDAYENGIADPFDGMGRIVTDGMSYIFKDGSKKSYGRQIVVNTDLEGMGKLGVFCLAQYESVADMKAHYETMLQKFPNTTHILIIRSPNTFAKDIQSAIPMVAGGTVRYGEKREPPQHTDDMWKQALYKRTQYSYQKEFRFVFTRSEFNVPFSYKYENRSQMILLGIEEIESYIADNLDIDIEIVDSDDIVLESDNEEKTEDYIMTDLTLEEL